VASGPCAAFDLIMAWSVDRLGRSLQDLVAFLEHLRSTKVELFLHQQGLDTSTSAGRAMFGMLSVFSEFERSIIRERVAAGMARAKVSGTKSGKAIGRAPTAQAKRADILRLKAEGVGAAEIARQLQIGRASVYRVLDGVVAPRPFGASAAA
jgi:DNA invertase Pin-like site-specific DNA recombinase